SWGDPGRSIFRPQWTLDELERSPLFTYRARCLVDRFEERAGGVRVEGQNAETGARESFDARALVLAAGTFGTARIVLRSLDRYDTPLSLVSNAYSYVPMLNL